MNWDCDIVVRKFELQSHFDVPIQTNALGKAMKLLSSQL